MSGFLLDTNILSELRKESRCDPGVRTWFEKASSDQLFISVLVLGEIRQGIERIRLRDQPQAEALEKWLTWISSEFADHILPVDEHVAEQSGRLGSRQTAPVLDSLIAATALTHNLAVVSRDAEGFRNTGVRLINPFAQTTPKAK